MILNLIPFNKKNKSMKDPDCNSLLWSILYSPTLEHSWVYGPNYDLD